MSSNLVILHIDMNSYFASVEQQANPHLRGKPVGVCAYMGKNGAIIASSIEAKARGVKIMRSWEAKKLCPEIILVQNDPEKYRSTTKRIFKILSEYTDRLEPYSIDEAFLDLTGYAKNLEKARDIGIEIKSRIKTEVGGWLRSSVGIAPTRFLAKLRSDNQEKDGIGILDKSDIPVFIELLKLTDICGINTRMQARLNELEIYTPNALREYSPSKLLIALGKFGYYLWANLNGQPVDRVTNQSERPPKSIGHSYCLPRKTTDKKWLASVFLKLCEKTGRRLREQNFEAHGISVSVGFVHQNGFHTHKRLHHAMYATDEIFEAGWGLAEPHIKDRANFLAVSVHDFTPISQQLSLFENNVKKNNARQLLRSIDVINNRYGEYAIYKGNMFGTAHNAPDRIGYRKTVVVE